MIGRRAVLAGAFVAACTKKDSASAAPSPGSSASPEPLPPMPPPDAGPAVLARGETGTQTFVFDDDNRAVVVVPSWLKEGERLPVLVALHGRGEANKGPERGAQGWPSDYALLRAIKRLCAPPLTTLDYEGFVERGHLAEVNQSLTSRPFGGLIVVCPYCPDLDLRKLGPIRDYGKYIVDKVLPRVRKELPAKPEAASTGIDGVSLGGAIGLRVGLGNPEAFGAVGSLQAAIGEDQVESFTDAAKSARAKNPALALKLLTSKEDYFRNAIAKVSASWRASGIAHDYADVPGPHDYPFNRGPGSLEMLMWHDKKLAR